MDLFHVNDVKPLQTDLEKINEKMEKWLSKPLHGRFANDMRQAHVDIEASNKWLSLNGLFVETEGFMLAIQDQVIATKNYMRYIMKLDVDDDLCRRCRMSSETIQHITGGCQVLASSEYTQRHNDVAKIVHLALAYKHSLLKKKASILEI